MRKYTLEEVAKKLGISAMKIYTLDEAAKKLGISTTKRYTLAETAKKLGISKTLISEWRGCGKLPEPEKYLGKLTYTAKVLSDIAKKMNQPGWKHARNGEPLLSPLEMAKMCGVSLSVLQKCIKSGEVPAPTRGSDYRPLYTPDLIDAVRDGINNRITKRPSKPANVQASNGYLSKVRTAKRLNITVVTLNRYISKGVIPAPGHLIGGCFYYSIQEVDSFAPLVDAQKKK